MIPSVQKKEELINTSISEEKEGPTFKVSLLNGESWNFPHSSIRKLRVQIAQKLNTISAVVTLLEGNEVIEDEYEGDPNKYGYLSGVILLSGFADTAKDLYNESGLGHVIVNHLDVDDTRVLEWMGHHCEPPLIQQVVKDTWLTAAIYGSEKTVTCFLDYKKTIRTSDVDHALSYPLAAAVQYLLEEHNEHINIALLYAAGNGHHSIVYHLIQGCANVNYCNDDWGYNAIMNAAAGGHLDVVNLLINAGVNINSVMLERGENALIFSSVEGHSTVVHRLIEERADINHRQKNGFTALISSASQGHLDIVNQLIDGHADLNLMDRWSNTALMWAVKNNHREIADRLQEINTKNERKSIGDESTDNDLISHLQESRTVSNESDLSRVDTG